MTTYLTIGQTARRLRVSISTLKRWLAESGLEIADRRNHIGWRLFTQIDIEALREYKTMLKRTGRRFNDTTLMPAVHNELPFRKQA